MNTTYSREQTPQAIHVVPNGRRNVVIMTVKGRKDLTERCVRSFAATTSEDERTLLLADGSEYEDRVTHEEWMTWFPRSVLLPVPCPNTNISQGWNAGIQFWMRIKPDMTNDRIWLLNNDVVFRKPGWLKLLSDRLDVPGTGMVGAYTMSVFGLPFATGGIWGFPFGVAMQVAEEGYTKKVLDERFNLSCQDVDLSVRIANAGYTVTHVPDIEFGNDPYLLHGISQTVSQGHSPEELYKMREPERKLLIDKHGRRDGRIGYDGVVEGT
jgi:GT2 family glycosyltransferase